MPTMKPSLTTTFNANLTKVKPTNILVFDREVSAVPGIVKLTGGTRFPSPRGRQASCYPSDRSR